MTGEGASFRTLGIPLLAGRAFTGSDVRGAPPVAVVNEAFARRFGLGRETVGTRLGRGGLDAALDTEIVGLVADARQDNAIPAPPLLYVPYRQEETVESLAFYVRSALPAAGMLRSISAQVAELAPSLPVTDLKTLLQQVEDNGFQDRAMAVLSAAFAAIATLLAAIGLYGVLAYAVAQRTREIGLRMALGAEAARLRVMVLVQVGRMTLAGGALGLGAALGLIRPVLTETPMNTGVSRCIRAIVAVTSGYPSESRIVPVPRDPPPHCDRRSPEDRDLGLEQSRDRAPAPRRRHTAHPRADRRLPRRVRHGRRPRRDSPRRRSRRHRSPLPDHPRTARRRLRRLARSPDQRRALRRPAR